MHSELHDRLEYLVNYSSQLIFVSGDSVAQQQKTLEAFVFNQPNDTEIAYISANQQMEIADYRCQLCRQLLGQTVGSYVRPLNELLSSLNNHEGPILITITQAQHMPDQLLQELWDLVLQSRFAANKQHLNVLVFGETRWAERAKQWLPAKNTTTPLLISSQSVLPSDGELTVDKLIAQRRQDFEKHLAARYSADQILPTGRPNTAILWTLIIVVFLATFGALVGWLYSDKIIALFQPLESAPATKQTESIAVGTAYEELVSSQVDEKNVSAPEVPLVERVDEAENVEKNPKNTETGLVASWPDALVQTETRSTSEPRATETLTNTAEEIAPHVIESAQQDNPRPTDTSNTQLQNASAESELTSTIKQVKEEEVTGTHYYIQLAGLKDDKLLVQFVQDYKLSAVVNMYQTQRYGADWFVLLFHQPFTSLDSARAAMNNLPDYPNRDKAFVKSGKQIKAELNQ
ncbi:SPOR domain-containing protein [Alteromonas sp. ASW11-130]|uniref:SPOR domain-containing protein n=1 Tax=Alteromonas sp. ASW11-130 TaxID=3015775 RepID=UPI00224294E2|nr:cell division protein DamX [Alteromonas sp. ASW11-130]MCW8090932.1 cell division protein DamX [Alteromonas sp. ASW11-130]